MYLSLSLCVCVCRSGWDLNARPAHTMLNTHKHTHTHTHTCIRVCIYIYVHNIVRAQRCTIVLQMQRTLYVRIIEFSYRFAQRSLHL